MKKAIANNGKEKEIRIALHKVTMQIINTILIKHKDRLEKLTHNLSDKYLIEIGDIACFLAVVRTHISRDYRGDMAALPEPEYPTRLAKTMCKLVDAHSILYDREPTDEDMKVSYRLASDNIPTERLKVLNVLMDGEARTTTEVQTIAKIPTTTARRILDDLKTLEIIDYYSMGAGKPDIWTLTNEEYRDILVKIAEKSKHEKKKTSTDDDEPRGEIRTGAHIEEVNLLKRYSIINNNNKEEEKKDNNDKIELYAPLVELHPTLKQEAETHHEKRTFDKMVENTIFTIKDWYDNIEKMTKESWDYVLHDVMVQNNLPMPEAFEVVKSARVKLEVSA